MILCCKFWKKTVAWGNKQINRKRGRKIKPGEWVVDLENQEPCRSQNSKKKKKISPVKTKAANYIHESEDEEEEWRCYH